MAEVLGVKFAPLNVPLKRRRQTFSTLLFVGLYFFFPGFFILCFLWMLFCSSFYWLALGYLYWVVYDVYILKTSSRGGRRSFWVRSSAIMQHFRDYFPVHLIKTADLDPNKNYIFGSHPHGILGCGSVINFATEATGFSAKFPGLIPHLLTLRMNFSIPLLRGFFLSGGLCDVSKESIQWILSKQGKGNVAIVVVGGAEEALETHPGNYTLKLRTRKGFIKLALKAGASLVPVYSFGENDLYNQVDNPSGSYLRAVQEKVKVLCGVSPPLFYGRGVFNYTFGIMPHRRPIYTFVGRAIDVPYTPNPSQEVIDKVHQQYMEELERLFNENKEHCGVSSQEKLKLV